jgi:hypothetical protein
MTETAESPYLLEVRGDNPHQIQEDLNAAVDQAVSYATAVGRHGVLATQHRPTLYTVALNPAVPYGQIHERRLMDLAGAGSE